ncbi:unnamed protein product [Macrosiphum euphorbiae]|uniref:RNA-directed DNA polymerase from mobile element jockey n=1 Tax=Macrosiphum euphorbiae TaxID=13131 RepID=A0AAV0WTP9_9HEMI|nr:unnamed protein product [Macrosiphum euphorbiae]
MKLKLQYQHLEFSNHAKYLGVTFNNDISFDKHIQNTIRKARGARAALHPILNRNSTVPLANKLIIYKIYLKPIILYAAPVWRNRIRRSSWKQIEIFQSVALRTMTGAHYLVSNVNIRNSMSIETLQNEALHLSKNLAHSLLRSKYPHLSCLVP